MHSKLDDMKGKSCLSIYISIYVHVYLLFFFFYLSIHILIYISMSVSVFLEITKLYSITVLSAVCPTGNLWFYHKNAIIAAIRPKNLVVSLCETSQQNTTQKTYICASEDILLLKLHTL